MTSESQKAYRKRWREENREHVNARRRARRALNPEKERALDRAEYHRNPSRRVARAKAEYYANKELFAERKAAWLKANPEKAREQHRGWVAKNKARNAGYKARERRDHPERALLNKARARAKALGVPFDLDASDIVIPEFCPALGIPLIVGHGARFATPNSPSIDRIVPYLGYVRGNIAIISHRANSLKSNASVEELRRVFEYARLSTAAVLRSAA